MGARGRRDVMRPASALARVQARIAVLIDARALVRILDVIEARARRGSLAAG